MQTIADILQVLTLGAVAVLGVLLFIIVLKLKKMKKAQEELIVTIEEGRGL